MLKQVLISAVTMLILDGLWLGVIANRFYFNNLRPLVRAKGDSFDVNYVAAGVVYVLMVLGFMLFIAPSLQKWNFGETVLNAALLGLVIYGVYDFTNLATLRDWSVLVTFVDLLWGSFLFATTAVVVKVIS
jgi:uncharacterized membrane protein